MRSLLWEYFLDRHTGCEHCLRPSVNIICFPLLFEGDLKDRGAVKVEISKEVIPELFMLLAERAHPLKGGAREKTLTLKEEASFLTPTLN